MNSPVVGTLPWLPPPLNRWKWLTAPIPAERLAGWRIVTGLVLLLDALLFYMPMLIQLYGPGSLAEPDVFADRFAAPHWNWSLLHWLPKVRSASICLGVWIGASALLVLGWRPRLMALFLWALSLSFYNTNFYLHNSGDRIRHFILLLLILAPSDAAWSIRRRPRVDGPVFVSAWPARLMLIQMVLMYFMNGYYKLQGKMWWDGSIMHYVNHDLAWARWSAVAIPYSVSQAMTWAALIWEVGFPLWILWRPTRVPALIFGVVFHVLTFFHLDIAAFPLYSLCLYVPLAPWERLRRRRQGKPG
ncbi:MAG: HTTM domain-containing protein [Planctomycetes bacterium]|nr:HTTM domain-containing protein [Planctomycetota bacterium]